MQGVLSKLCLLPRIFLYSNLWRTLQKQNGILLLFLSPAVSKPKVLVY